MNQALYDTFLQVLHKELIPALGCTEPIAIAYAAAKARQVLGEKPQRIHLRCSGNIIKNVKGVAVPNAGGLKGVEAAAILGAIGGDADRELEVLQAVKPSIWRRPVPFWKPTTAPVPCRKMWPTCTSWQRFLPESTVLR